jgi:hypothetical protein
MMDAVTLLSDRNHRDSVMPLPRGAVRLFTCDVLGGIDQGV